MTPQQQKHLEDNDMFAQIGDKTFIKYAGLLYLGEQMGVTSIITRLTHEDLDKQIFHFKATVKGIKMIHGEPREVIYRFHGDANADNVSRMVRDSIRRVAETRAVARALRAYCSVGMCSLEELAGDDNRPKQRSNPTKRKRSRSINPVSARSDFSNMNIGQFLSEADEASEGKQK